MHVRDFGAAGAPDTRIIDLALADGRTIVSADTDIGSHFVTVDAFYVDSERDTGDGAYFGFGTVQRKGLWDTAFRIMGSVALDDETSAVRSGVLGFASFSTTPETSDDTAMPRRPSSSPSARTSSVASSIRVTAMPAAPRRSASRSAPSCTSTRWVSSRPSPR